MIAPRLRSKASALSRPPCGSSRLDLSHAANHPRFNDRTPRQTPRRAGRIHAPMPPYADPHHPAPATITLILLALRMLVSNPHY